MKKLTIIASILVGLLTASAGYGAMVDCFDSKNRKQASIKSFPGNKKAKVYFGIAPMAYEIYVLTNTSVSRQNLTETYSKVYSNYVKPKETKTVVYSSKRMSNGGFAVIVDGRKLTCKKK